MSKCEINSEYEQIVVNHKNYQLIKQNIRNAKRKLHQFNNDKISTDIEFILKHDNIRNRFSYHRRDGFMYYVNLFIRPSRKNYSERKIIVLEALKIYSLRFVCEKLHISAHTIQKMKSNEIHLSKIQKNILDFINSQKNSISYQELQTQFNLSLRQIQRHIAVLDRNALIISMNHQRVDKNEISNTKIS
jgi:hypothetical protein